MIRKGIKNKIEAASLSVDSLVDVFMNAFAIVMFASIALVLQLGTSRVAESKSTEKDNTSTQLELRLPASRDVQTNPVYLWLREDGIKVISGNNSLSYRTTIQTSENNQDEVRPLTGSYISTEELSAYGRLLDRSKNHVIMLVHPLGIKHYKNAKQTLEQTGILSGWIVFKDDVVYLGENGRSPTEVQ